MRRAVILAAAACLLAGPTVLAFFTGGFPAEPRLIAALVTWLLVLLLAIAGPAPLPRRTPARLALGGLAALAAWTALSTLWAPVAGPAMEDAQRLALYTGALLLAAAVFTEPRALRAVEPALAAGSAVVIGYGLAGRLLPGILDLARSRSAGGRLEQPITYWNAEGALAAVGLVLCARLAGDPSRPRAVRVLAAAACPVLGTGVYLTYSRGALAAALLGLAVLVAAAPDRAQLRAVAAALATGIPAAVITGALPGVAALEGGHRIRDGLIGLAALAVLAGLAAAYAARTAAAGAAPLPDPWPGRLPRIAAALVAALAIGLVAGGLAERPSAAELSAGANATRLTSVSSNRYEYWRVAADGFAREPLTGLGAGGFRVEWLKERTFREAVRDTHSIEVEVLAELGLAGLAAFLALVTGVALAGRRALKSSPVLAAGPVAGTLVWFLHASIDWDWQLPAVTLPALVLAGALLALSERSPAR